MSYPKKNYTLGMFLSFSFITYALTGCQSSTSNISKYQKPAQLQLLNVPSNYSTSEIAKQNLVSAIKKKFDTEHMSVSTATYATRSFVLPDSVDANSESFFVTMVNASSKSAKEKEALLEKYIQEIEYEQEERIAIAKGNDEEIEILDAEDIQNKAEERMELEEDNSQSALDMLKSNNISNKKIKNVLQEYARSQTEEVETHQVQVEGDTPKSPFDSILKNKSSTELMLEVLRGTPEQNQAMNTHYLQNLNINKIGHYQPQNKSYRGVLSYDYHSPTQQLSIQLPYGVNFEKGSVIVDPSAGLPLIALLKPEMLADIEKNKTNTVILSLPKAFRDTIPTDIVFDAFIKGNNRAFAELDSEYYTPLDISNDTFAKQVSAKKAVKIHWGMKQTGEYIGKVVKSMSQDLNAHIGNHPEKYSFQETKKLNNMLEAWASLEQGFQSKDVGSLLQSIEAILPISANQTMYYYLNNKNDLQAYQTKMSIGSEIFGLTMDTVVQTKYDMTSVRNSNLYTLYDEDFGEKSPQPFDINTWISSNVKNPDADSEKVLMKHARYARYDYPDWDEIPNNNAALASISFEEQSENYAADTANAAGYSNEEFIEEENVIDDQINNTF